MQKRWTALALAALMLVTTSCHRQTQPEDSSQSSQSTWTQSADSSQREEPEPVKEPPSWEEGRTVDDLPDDYNGLELPIQGATGYASVKLPLWAAMEDSEAAALAVEEWEKAQEEAERLAQEQAAAAAQAQGQAQAAAQASDTAAPETPVSEAESVPGAEPVQTQPDTSSSEETAAPAQEQPAQAQDGAQPEEGQTQPEQPAAEEGSSAGEAPAPETPAAPEPTAPQTESPAAPETGETPEGEAGTEPEEEEKPPTLTDGALALLAPGTPFTVLREEGAWWEIAVTADCFTDEEQIETESRETTGWVEHKYCFVNLPDVIPSIIYDATNSYSSHFVSCGKRIPEVTGEAFYPSKTYNQRLGKMEFMMPVLYSMAFRLCEAQQNALAEGNSLILYEGYRPHSVQTQVLSALSAIARTDPEVKEAVTGEPWSISWFISGGYSNHQRGYAVDMGLAKVTATKEYTTGGLRYVRVWNYERYEMPTPIHELSRAAATFTAPVTINSTTAWKSAELSQDMAANEPALGLQRYCTDAELTPLASEWWHFNDLATRSQVLSNQGTGGFAISSVRSTAPG